MLDCVFGVIELLDDDNVDELEEENNLVLVLLLAVVDVDVDENVDVEIDEELGVSYYAVHPEVNVSYLDESLLEVLDTEEEVGDDDSGIVEDEDEEVIEDDELDDKSVSDDDEAGVVEDTEGIENTEERPSIG